jgi:hypothetical protein
MPLVPNLAARPSIRIPLAAALIALIAPLAPAPARAQMVVPDSFTNLKVLPKDITKPQLLGTMRSFSLGLGVRCDYCHARADSSGAAAERAPAPLGAPGAPGAAGRPGGPPERLNFASDAKEQKRIARGMLQMVHGINADYLARIAELKDSSRVEVQCVTCHHGVAIPRPLTDILAQDVTEKSAAAAVTHYRQLKAQYYGSAAYDFREFTLEEIARQLAQAGKPDDALVILDLAAQEFPQSGVVPFQQGEILLQKGDRAGALARYRHALELQPQNEAARRRITELQGGS